MYTSQKKKRQEPILSHLSNYKASIIATKEKKPMPSISHNSHIPYAILNIKARVSNLSMSSIHTIRMRTIDTIRCWLIIFVPVGKNLLDLGGVGETIDILKVLLGDLERTSCDIGNVFANQLAWIDGCLVDLLEKEGSERLDT